MLVHKSNIFNIPDFQTEINETMRAILVDWLVDLADGFRSQPETLFLTVTLLDAYLLQEKVVQRHFQLLGCACFLVASKFQETQPPMISNIVESAAYSFTLQDLIETEQKLMIKLKFYCNLPTRDFFSNRLLLVAECTEREKSFVNLLMELSLLDYTYTQYPMSMVAAGAVHLTRQIFRPLTTTIWTTSLSHYSSYSESELVEVVQCLQRLYTNMSSERNELNAVIKKYERFCYHRISRVTAVSENALRFDFISGICYYY